MGDNTSFGDPVSARLSGTIIQLARSRTLSQIRRALRHEFGNSEVISNKPPAG